MATKKEKPLGEQFREAAARVEKLSARPSNEQLLDLPMNQLGVTL